MGRVLLVRYADVGDVGFLHNAQPGKYHRLPER